MVTTKAIPSLWDNFNQLTPYAVGFDRMINHLNMINERTIGSQGFPPYNIQKDGDYTYKIEMALAGFSKEDIEIEWENGKYYEPDFIFELENFKIIAEVKDERFLDNDEVKKRWKLL